MSNNQYPAWQSEIRKAQNEQKQIDALMERSVADAVARRRAAKDAYDAGLLAWTLRNLGIPVETPAPKLQFGSFEFYILRLNVRGRGEWDEDINGYRYILVDTTDCEIELGIHRLTELTPEEEDELDEYLNYGPVFRELTMTFPADEQKRTLYRARLADTLDSLEDGFALFRQDVDALREKRRAAASGPVVGLAAPHISTPEERLIAALTAFIGSRIDDLNLEKTSDADFGF